MLNEQLQQQDPLLLLFRAPPTGKPLLLPAVLEEWRNTAKITEELKHVYQLLYSHSFMSQSRSAHYFYMLYT